MQRLIRTTAALFTAGLFGACGIRSEVGGVSRDGAAGADAGLSSDGGAERPVTGGAGAGGGAGAAGGNGGSIVPPSACAPDLEGRVPPAPLRRLDNFEYKNTVRTLLGLSVSDSVLPTDGWPSPAGGDSLAMITDAHHAIAHDFAVAATKDAASINAITGCDVTASGETACLDRLLDGVVARLFRRPLEAGDRTELAALFAQGRSLGGTYATGVRAVLEVALQSPELLYRAELGETVDANRPLLGRPRAFEMATRLSYLLWGGPPDDLLWQAAAADQLKTATQIGLQARRMLADARAHDATRRFFLQLLKLPYVEATAGPAASSDVKASFLQETAAFVDDVVWSGAGDLKTLLTSPFGFVNEATAKVYGIAGVTGTTLRKVTLPPAQRKGLLTQGSFLTTFPSNSVRGLRIHQQLLCGSVQDGDPTPDSERAAWPPPDPSRTRRQYIEGLTAPAKCQSCHGQFDPIGFAFGHYDSAAAWTAMEGSLAIDARGAIAGGDAAGTFDGPLALADRLATSRDVLDCHVQKWMESAYGREVAPADACSREVLEGRFASTGGNIPELMIAITQTDSFLYRPAP